MNAGTLIRLGLLAALTTLTGCGAATQIKDDRAILSAADVQSMIRVEVAVLEQPALAADELILAAID